MLKLGGEQLRGLKVQGLPPVQLSAARVAECVACRSV